jgi:hypothetical protein
MSLHSDILFWFRANQCVLFHRNDSCLAEKQHILILWSLGWPDQGSNPQSTALEASTLSITPQILFKMDRGKPTSVFIFSVFATQIYVAQWRLTYWGSFVKRLLFFRYSKDEGIFAIQGLRSALLIFTLGIFSRIFVIPAHCHLLDFDSYAPCNDVIFRQSTRGFHFLSF